MNQKINKWKALKTLDHTVFHLRSAIKSYNFAPLKVLVYI